MPTRIDWEEIFIRRIMGIFLLILVIGVVSVIVVYNRLVRARIHVREGFSGMDVQLKRRHDLIPNLVATVKGYVKHEAHVLEEVTKLRARVMSAMDIKERAQLEGGITQALKTIFAVAEEYPDLKANQSFLNLQESLGKIEDELQLSRRYYNGAVRNLNVMVESFPSNIIAQAFHFKKETFFEVGSSQERQSPNIKF